MSWVWDTSGDRYWVPKPELDHREVCRELCEKDGVPVIVIHYADGTETELRLAPDE
jgi:hypothetical protein